MPSIDFDIDEDRIGEYIEEVQGLAEAYAGDASGHTEKAYNNLQNLLEEENVESSEDLEQILRSLSAQSVTNGKGVTVVKSERQIAEDLYREAYENID